MAKPFAVLVADESAACRGISCNCARVATWHRKATTTKSLLRIVCVFVCEYYEYSVSLWMNESISLRWVIKGAQILHEISIGLRAYIDTVSERQGNRQREREGIISQSSYANFMQISQTILANCEARSMQQRGMWSAKKTHKLNKRYTSARTER